ncbi:asparagine synthase domain-containing protein [Klebsormidium nitens]|uniref:Asparagine synthase domain-containing protein n=1 Tax=Klebsormidium nitens TaxID=105231 RepID=A0A1Y1HVS4_KLENI|nr:asparagine synthase domain-containing protein [Klebsormidium nitens]|eukprot:GAQ79948.1 asparagine synthase domain-containing protein [Klebsormidium nitens]
MCGIAFVLKYAHVRCSACGAAFLSYQEECDHGRLGEDTDDVSEEESRASIGLEGAQRSDGETREAACNIGPSIEDLAQELQRRGPDGVCHLSIPLADVSTSTPGGTTKPSDSTLHFIGAELQLRGAEVVSQPLEDGCGNVLVFNGEIFGGLHVAPNENDGQKLLEALRVACACPPTDVTNPLSDVTTPSLDASPPLNDPSNGEYSGSEPGAKCSQCHRPPVVRILSELRGPWALAYWQAAIRTLWYGRDFVGRRSLVAHLPDELDGRFIVSSVAVTKRRSVESVVENGQELVNEFDEGLSDLKLKEEVSGGESFINEEGTSRLSAVQAGAIDPSSKCPTATTDGSDEKLQRQANVDLEAGRFSVADDLGKERNGNGRESGRDASGAGRGGPEEEALFDFWVDVPAGVHSYRPENGAHARHAWSDPQVARLSRWRRDRVEPPDDVSGCADVSYEICGGAGRKSEAAEGAGRAELANGSGREQHTDGEERVRSEEAMANGDSAEGSSEVERSDRGNVVEIAVGGGFRTVAERGPEGEVVERGAERWGGGVGEGLPKDGQQGGGAEARQWRGAADTCKQRGVKPKHDEFEDAVERLLEALSQAVAKRVTGIRKRDESGCYGRDRSSGELRNWSDNGFSNKSSNGLDRLTNGLCNVQGNNASGSPPSNGPIGSTSATQSASSFETADVSSGRPGRPADMAVLFSGGLDSMILAALVGRHVTEGATIDLINVCFDGGTSPDRLSAIAGLKELKTLFPGRRWRLIRVDSSLAEVDLHRPRLLSLICPSQTYMDLNIGAALWLAARGRGFVAVEAASESDCKRLQSSNSLDEQLDCAERAQPRTSDGRSSNLQGAEPSNRLESREETRIGPECTVLRAAEGQSRKAESQSDGAEDSGDRRADDWRHIEAGQLRRSHGRRSGGEDGCDIGRSDDPHRTAENPYTSSARVLLVGSGADEQCAGYGRHRTKFREGGWQRLDAEMRLDVLRLWQRNLGRDDRCIADHGKEARFPFLDEDVMSLLLSLPLWTVADPRLPSGVGDKKLLRAVARRLGIRAAAALPKRAIQFGSRIARASNRRDFGSNRAANASAAGGVSFRKDRSADPT